MVPSKNTSKLHSSKNDSVSQCLFSINWLYSTSWRKWSFCHPISRIYHGLPLSFSVRQSGMANHPEVRLPWEYFRNLTKQGYDCMAWWHQRHGSICILETPKRKQMDPAFCTSSLIVLRFFVNPIRCGMLYCNHFVLHRTTSAE